MLQESNFKQITKLVNINIKVQSKLAATCHCEEGIASNQISSRFGEYVLAFRTHRPSLPESRFTALRLDWNFGTLKKLRNEISVFLR